MSTSRLRSQSNAAVEAYVKQKYWPIIKDDIKGEVVFTGFGPDPYRMACIAQFLVSIKNPEPGKTHCFVNITFHMDEIALIPEELFHKILHDKIDQAMRKLIELVCDPFDAWVREVRSGSISDTD